MGERCSNCRFYHERKQTRECRKSPPQIVIAKNGDAHTLFPAPCLSWWCGDWEARDEEPVPEEKRMVLDDLEEGGCFMFVDESIKGIWIAGERSPGNRCRYIKSISPLPISTGFIAYGKKRVTLVER